MKQASFQKIPAMQLFFQPTSHSSTDGLLGSQIFIWLLLLFLLLQKHTDGIDHRVERGGQKDYFSGGKINWHDNATAAHDQSSHPAYKMELTFPQSSNSRLKTHISWLVASCLTTLSAPRWHALSLSVLHILTVLYCTLYPSSLLAVETTQLSA